MNNENDKLMEKILIDQELRTAIARQSHQWFFNIYFSHYIEHKASPFHKTFFDLTENESIKNIVIVAFRGSAKSSIMSVSYPIWSIVGKQQKKFVVIIGQTQRQAKFFLNNIKKELESNQLLRNDFGPFEEQDGDEWSAYSLVLSWYDARIAAVSMEQTIRSIRHKQYRPDIIISDDIEDLTSVRTIENRDKIEDWITGEIIPAGDRNTRTIFIGNLLHQDSLLMRMKKRIRDKTLDGIFKEIPLLDNKNNIAWPGKYPTIKDVENEKRKIGMIAYKREYLLKIISNRGQIVHESWIHYYDELPVTENNNNFRYTTTGIDPAVSQKDGACYTAMVSGNIYGYEKDLRIYILPNPINKRLNGPQINETAKLISDTLGKGDKTQLYIEDVAMQRLLVDRLKDEGYPAEGVSVHGNDKEARLTIISNLIKEGNILFPRKGAELLINQIVHFSTEKYKDLADAFTILVLAVTREKKPAEPRITWIFDDDEDDGEDI